jgi:adenylate cyclase
VAEHPQPHGTPEATARENLRLARRVARLEFLVGQIEQIRDANAALLSRVMQDLDVERQRSHELLLNVLPERIVTRLDAGETNIADRHANVAVVMTDLVGFTPAAAQLTPTELVAELNDLFSAFDDACNARGVEKIKTIGDAYMAVAGLDGGADARHREPVAAAAHLALDMFEALESTGSRWRMRIGIHAGPVVAGIIGTRKFAYDVWGDTVNVAARLETTAEPGRVHVSSDVAEALGDAFVLERRGLVDLKGKGAMNTWFVVGRR